MANEVITLREQLHRSARTKFSMALFGQRDHGKK